MGGKEGQYFFQGQITGSKRKSHKRKGKRGFQRLLGETHDRGFCLVY